MRGRPDEPIVSIVQVPVSRSSFTRLRREIVDERGLLPLIRSVANVRMGALAPLREVRAAIQEHAAVTLSMIAIVRLVRDGSVDVGATRIRLKVPPRVPAEPEMQTPVFDAKHNLAYEWPEPSQAPRVPRSVWDEAWAACGSREPDHVQLAPMLKPIRSAALDLSMVLTLDDAVILVRAGAVFTRATWSRVPAYIVYARDGGHDVYLTVSAAPPMGGGGGGG